MKVTACPFCNVTPECESFFKRGFPNPQENGLNYRIAHYCEKISMYCESKDKRKAVGMWNDYIDALPLYEQLSLFGGGS